jgi:lipid A disaccharide synthetase
VPEQVITGLLQRYAVRADLVSDVFALMRDSDFAYVTSGTATLQLAHFLTPMVVIYRINKVSWCIGRPFIRVPFIALVNLVAGRRVVPEFLLTSDRSRMLAEVAEELLRKGPAREAVIAGLREVKGIIDVPGAAEGAAREVLALAARGREPAAKEEFVSRVFQDLLGPLVRRCCPGSGSPAANADGRP